jgi:hypothetical protein
LFWPDIAVDGDLPYEMLAKSLKRQKIKFTSQVHQLQQKTKQKQKNNTDLWVHFKIVTVNV